MRRSQASATTSPPVAALERNALEPELKERFQNGLCTISALRYLSHWVPKVFGPLPTKGLVSYTRESTVTVDCSEGRTSSALMDALLCSAVATPPPMVMKKSATTSPTKAATPCRDVFVLAPDTNERFESANTSTANEVVPKRYHTSSMFTRTMKPRDTMKVPQRNRR